jgi:hypothetical protein
MKEFEKINLNALTDGFPIQFLTLKFFVQDKSKNKKY